MRKRILMFIALFLLAGMVGFLTAPGSAFFKRVPLNRLHAAYLYWNTKVHASTNIVPFTIYMTERATQPGGYVRDGNRLFLANTPTATLVLAQRSDGSTADYLGHPDSMKQWPTDRAWEEGTIIDLTNRRFVDTASHLKAKTTYPIKAASLSWYLAVNPSPASDCLLSPAGTPAWGYQSLSVVGHEQVAGYDTVKLVADAGIDPKTGDHNTLQKWLAPGLGCVAIRNIFTRTSSDNKLLYETVQEPDHIVLGQPPDYLFDPQLDELKPSDSLMRRKQYWAHFGADSSCPTCVTPDEMKKAAENDKKYAAAQANR